jgi:RNA polymerase sigma-70 factor, ECF subfamily
MTGDFEIIRRISEGDIKEFETLFRSSYASLVKYAKTLIKDHDAAEEIVQELFFKIWQNKEKIKIESSINGYLFRSVHNRCLHYIEHLKVIEKHEKEMSYNPDSEAESPADLLQYKELQAKIARTIERLPQNCARIFCMNRFDGLKYSEIAEKLSISVKTVEANMGKALREFRRALAE